jgi:hypothetical protein
MSFSRLSRAKLDPEDIGAIIEEMERDGPRGAAILGATLVEAAIGSLLLAKMRPLEGKDVDDLFGDMKPLSTLSAKIKVGYAFRLFGPLTRGDLEKIRGVRNAFAHASRLIDFSTHEVAQACLGLNCTTRFKTADARQAYTMSTKMLTSHMLMKFRDLGPIAPGYEPLD